MLREGDVRIPAGCAIAALVNLRGLPFAGTRIADCIAVMRERSNGLGGGFAAYGIYPEMKDYYAVHVFFDGIPEKREFEYQLRRHFRVVSTGPIPTRRNDEIHNPPIIWRYFVSPENSLLAEEPVRRQEFMVSFITGVNAASNGAYIVSFGKNMGVFKGVGFPEDIADFFRLDEYRGYLWTAHGRFPTNTPGWWGGAHPFALLETTVIHNGEISSYDANRRFIEMYGYRCSLQTDTEVIAYIFDFLCRRLGMSQEEAALIVAPPLWDELAMMEEETANRITRIRAVFSSLLLNGPFSIVLATPDGIMALNDRLKLRPMVAAENEDFVAVASEEAAIRKILTGINRIWSPRGGEPVWGKVDLTHPEREPLYAGEGGSDDAEAAKSKI
ncbi:MAG: glutamine amidotransferase family protein [Syntrophomonadaceae bacterium]|nr:glutamine amidotransferase family protein [Syntrophomonadaceae bacterium]